MGHVPVATRPVNNLQIPKELGLNYLIFTCEIVCTNSEAVQVISHDVYFYSI